MKRMCAMLLSIALMITATPARATSSASPSPSPTGSPSPTPSPDMGLSPVGFDQIIKQDSEGDIVVLIQERLADLNYFNFKVTGFYGQTTAIAVMAFQRAHNLEDDGEVGPSTYIQLMSVNAKRGYGERGRPTPTPGPSSRVGKKTGKMLEWSKAKNMVAWSGGGRFKVRDFYTGDEYFFIRVGGTYHMDVEPAKANDTKIFKATYSGRWSYDRRPVTVRLGGEWYAGSVNGFPHGKETVSGNGMTGQVCLHFKNSRIHKTGIIDPAHQRCIRIAAGQS